MTKHQKKEAAEKLISAAITVAKLNYQKTDSIRPRTYGATDAFHALEDAAQEYLGEKWEYPIEEEECQKPTP
jgi:hypothetical protein